LEEADDFRRFSIGAAPGASLSAALDGLARLDGETHAWVFPATLRRLAPRGGMPAWEEGFGEMLAYATSKGWTDAEGAVRAHIAFI
jgi:hypothetical protein